QEAQHQANPKSSLHHCSLPPQRRIMGAGVRLGKLCPHSYNRGARLPPSLQSHKERRMNATRVRDLMRPNLITCPPNLPLGEVAAILIRHRVHAIIIADATGMPLGVLSDIDLLAGEW